MAAQTLTWSATSFGGFNEIANWQPRELPTPNIGQVLNILGGSMSITAEPFDDYSFNLLSTGSDIFIVFSNQVIDAETEIRQTASRAFLSAVGDVVSFGDIDFGATGLRTETTLTIIAGATFRNNGTIEVSGTFSTFDTGTFVNNGTFIVDGGVAVISNLARGQPGGSFIVEDGGTLQLNGVTNASISFASGSNGRVLFDLAGAAGAVAPVKGFDRGDEIVLPGTATTASYVGDADDGTLVLFGATGAEVGRIPFAGNYTTANFTLAAAPEGKTSVGSTYNTPPLGPGSATVAHPVLDLDDYGRRAATYTVNGANDATFALPRGVAVRDNALSRADFLDGSIVFDGISPNGRYVPNEDASGVARLYYTVLGRPPEIGGEKYWVGIMDSLNYSIQELAPYFYTSAEFRARYGSNTTDSQFVDLLYRNILGRAGEAEGSAYWQGQLGSGIGRDVLVYAFSESNEHKAIRYDAIERGGIVFTGDPFV
jgi:Domain of unknown function (DUF4214)